MDTRSPHPTAPREDLGELQRLARELAVQTGRLITRDRPEHLAVDTKSSRTDVVTQMDAAAERALRERLATLRPGDAIFGEEGGAQAGTSDLTWVLDPIDGTVNYLYGSAEYAVSVAAVVGDPGVSGGWRPLAGAVAHPVAGVVYSARRGGGAVAHSYDPDWSGNEAPRGLAQAGRALRTTAADSLDLTLLGTGFGYLPEVRRAQGQLLLELLPRVRDIRRGGSAALDLCAVAAGRLDAYYERGVNAWDFAAGWLVVTEAGGLVTSVLDDAPGDGGVVAAAPGVHAQLRALLNELGAG